MQAELEVDVGLRFLRDPARDSTLTSRLHPTTILDTRKDPVALYTSPQLAHDDSPALG